MDTDFSFSRALAEAHDFLVAVLPSLTSLAMRISRDETPPLVVYTDAMYQWELSTGGCAYMKHVLRIGFVVFCPLTSAVFYSHLLLPAWYFTHVFSPDLKTYIAQGEAVGALAGERCFAERDS